MMILKSIFFRFLTPISHHTDPMYKFKWKGNNKKKEKKKGGLGGGKNVFLSFTL